MIEYLFAAALGGVVWGIRLEGVVKNLKEQLDAEKNDRREVTSRLAAEIDNANNGNKKYFDEIIASISALRVDIARLQVKADRP